LFAYFSLKQCLYRPFWGQKERYRKKSVCSCTEYWLRQQKLWLRWADGYAATAPDYPTVG